MWNPIHWRKEDSCQREGVCVRVCVRGCERPANHKWIWHSVLFKKMTHLQDLGHTHHVAFYLLILIPVRISLSASLLCQLGPKTSVSQSVCVHLMSFIAQIKVISSMILLLFEFLSFFFHPGFWTRVALHWGELWQSTDYFAGIQLCHTG